MKKETTNKSAIVVAVLGHVDHGKTTLLDAIRHTKVVTTESGGITQGIGISHTVTKEGISMTFIDTPGHAAFSAMRSSGAKVADIAVLVVAADDGVMPQTKEAIEYLRGESVPFVVAVTKSDIPGMSPEKALGSLEKEGVLLEGRGGDVPFVEVSGKTGKGIDDLLEIISLITEVNGLGKGEIPSLKAIVIETGKDKRGSLVTTVVKSGDLTVGDTVYVRQTQVKIRGIFDDMGKSVNNLGHGHAALILGFNDLPEVGEEITGVPAKADKSQETENEIFKQSGEDKVTLVVKAKNQGSLDALLGSLNKEVDILASALGDVSESDVFMAKSTGAHITTFETKASNSVRKLADMEGVTIKSFDIIYELFNYVDDLVNAKKEKVLGSASILKDFSYKGTKRVAGVRMTEGVINKSEKLILRRGEKDLGEVKILSIRKGKEEVPEAKKGEEFGIYFEPQLDFQAQDVLISVAERKKSK